MTLWFPVSLVALVWSLLAVIGGLATVVYLGLGVTMTHTLDGVFGPEPKYRFNWAILWMALIGQLVGLIISLVIGFLALRHQRRGYRLGTAATVLGFVAAGIFLILGALQLPLLPILRDALAL